MAENSVKINIKSSYVLFGKENTMLETAGIVKQHLQIYDDCFAGLFRAIGKKPEPGYRWIGNYRVKETFEGTETLTTLLTQYVQRTVSMRC